MIPDQLVDQIYTEVLHLSNDSPPESDEFRKYAALALIARVPVLLSSGVYSSFLSGGIRVRGIQDALALGAGICGLQVELASYVLDALAIPSRDTQVFYREGDDPMNHTFVEIPWGGAWRLVDVTWGFIPHRGGLETALSYEQASSDGHRDGLHHKAIPWRVAVEGKYDIFGYLTPRPDAVYVRGHGDAHLDVVPGAMELPHPSTRLVGHLRHLRGETAEHSLRISVPEGRWNLGLTSRIHAQGRFRVGDDESPSLTGDTKIDLSLPGPATHVLSFRADQGSGYAELLSIHGTRQRLHRLRRDLAVTIRVV